MYMNRDWYMGFIFVHVNEDELCTGICTCVCLMHIFVDVNAPADVHLYEYVFVCVFMNM